MCLAFEEEQASSETMPEGGEIFLSLSAPRATVNAAAAASPARRAIKKVS